jgi:hypothetical protein
VQLSRPNKDLAAVRAGITIPSEEAKKKSPLPQKKKMPPRNSEGFLFFCGETRLY